MASRNKSCPKRARFFLEEADYQLFIGLLQETTDLFNVQVAAYCLMPTHLKMVRRGIENEPRDVAMI